MRDNETMKQTETDAGIAKCTDAIRLNPNDAEAYRERGNAYYEKNDYDNAIADYTDAILLTTSDRWAAALAHYRRAFAYLKKGYWREALADLDDTIRLDPDCLGYEACYEKEYLQAIVDAIEAVRANPDDPSAYFNRGEAYQKLYYANDDALDNAMADYTKALRLKPDYAEAYYGRGSVYRHKGDADSAIADFSEALRLDPGNAEKYCSDRGSLYRDKKDYYHAIADYAEVEQLRREKQQMEGERGRLLTQEKIDRLMSPVLEIEEDGIVAELIRQQAVYESAQAKRANPNGAAAYSDGGDAYNGHNSEDYLNRKMAGYSSALRLCAEAYCNMGRKHLKKGDLDRAIEDYGKALSLKPDYAEAYCGMGVAYWEKDELDKAIKNYRKAAKLRHDSYGVPWALYLARADRRFDNGEYELAIADYTKAANQKPYPGSIYYKLGVACALKGDEDSAFQSFCAAIRTSNNLKALIARGAIYNKRKVYEYAIKDFTEALQREPDNAEAKAGLEEAEKNKRELEKLKGDVGTETGSTINPEEYLAGFVRSAKNRLEQIEGEFSGGMVIDGKFIEKYMEKDTEKDIIKQYLEDYL